MYLYTATDKRTMKRHWHFGGKECEVCPYRFECFTDDRIHVKPVEVNYTEDAQHRSRRAPVWTMFKAEFHLPKCLRLGLYKQVADTGFWGHGEGEFGDGFKLGVIVGEEEHIDTERSWVKFPNILYVIGSIR